ncbi:PREDICTED: LOW QUALITY PROTEIN: zinc finger protein 277-like [Priapulus caudatus]|uniref:LOW QUALITY PROTEIN: zinc finger protein 277-like n=1 Tax=Priapulus caudatus TaxID=37621 RepID=A0ABM1F0D6_PRICU|nr:PREDICTED: LOW QUALITY PROTEIN: zinc finger protein 277-like [Priapulus caudatus]
MSFIQGKIPDDMKAARVIPITFYISYLAYYSRDNTEPISRILHAACPLCDECYCLVAARDEFLAHLLREHKFVIGEVHQVADMRRYVEYWKEKFQVSPLTEFCGVIKTNSKENYLGQEEYYFLLCDVLPEDKELREKLQRKKLEDVLIQQEKERTNSSFSRGCLFCKNQFSGSRGRQELLNHMAHLHGFSLGLPDNLVFTDELLDLLQDRVTKLYCLCCEKVFKDRMVLKEHMRKKKHKQLNPNNPEYDKFYVINYMGLGKDWRKVQSQLECENERDDSNTCS